MSSTLSHLLHFFFFFFFNDTATTEIYTLSLHDALPISTKPAQSATGYTVTIGNGPKGRSEEHTSELQSRFDLVCRLLLEKKKKTPSLLRALHAKSQLAARHRSHNRVAPCRTARRGSAASGRRIGSRLPLFFLRMRRPPRSTLFPYTSLFR